MCSHYNRNKPAPTFDKSNVARVRKMAERKRNGRHCQGSGEPMRRTTSGMDSPTISLAAAMHKRNLRDVSLPSANEDAWMAACFLSHCAPAAKRYRSMRAVRGCKHHRKTCNIPNGSDEIHAKDVALSRLCSKRRACINNKVTVLLKVYNRLSSSTNSGQEEMRYNMLFALYGAVRCTCLCWFGW